MRESVKIVLGMVGLAIVYGWCLDLVTAHLDVRYFTEFHPHVVDSKSPLVMALLWGMIATWWFGAIAGGVLAAVAQRGPKPQVPAKLILIFAAKCMVGVYSAALIVMAASMPVTPYLVDLFPMQWTPMLVTIELTHEASYLLNLLALGWVVRHVWRLRVSMGSLTAEPTVS